MAGVPTTRVEANSVIDKQLLAKGLRRGSLEYQMEKDKIWKENKFGGLPLQ